MQHIKKPERRLDLIALQMPNQVPPHAVPSELRDFLCQLADAVLTAVVQPGDNRRPHGSWRMPFCHGNDADFAPASCPILCLTDPLLHSGEAFPQPLVV